MKGDFSRDTFDRAKHFRRVLMQQGRVQLDADWNEQTAILLHYLQALAVDLIGPHGGPGKDDGTAGDDFKLESTGDAKDFIIHPGHYYVNGMLCENEEIEDAAGASTKITYFTQPNYPLDKEQDKLPTGFSLVYLDVWERHLTYLEMEEADGSVISIRESALGGPDTATRAQVVWQVKPRALETRPSLNEVKRLKEDYPHFLNALENEVRPGKGQLKARAIRSMSAPNEACVTSPESCYRGAENQLYRVEVHNGGSEATLKWSRENGSVIFPIRQMAEKSVRLETLGRDARLGLQVGDWVEIVDDDYTLRNRAEPLLRVDAIDYNNNLITLANKPASIVGQNILKHPLLRRWDQREKLNENGVLPINESTVEWTELENGIQIQFQPSGTYHTGDYWLVPARTVTGDVEWPGPAGSPIACGPHGIKHYYAPLWIISVDTHGKVDLKNDLRRHFKPLWKHSS